MIFIFFLSYQSIMFKVITSAIAAVNICCVLSTVLRARDKTVKKKVF